jgi:light-regulated signal transduction histidine kinase (bacteriophytochrome)
LSGEHPRPKSVDIIPIIKRVAGKTAEPLSSKHTIKMNLPRHLFRYVDPDRIENVIENLILNAIEAMAEQNGKLTIEAGVTTRGAAMFSISDTGPGMTKEFIAVSSLSTVLDNEEKRSGTRTLTLPRDCRSQRRTHRSRFEGRCWYDFSRRATISLSRLA